MNENKVIPMQAHNQPDRYPEPPYLKPVDAPSSQNPVSDRVILERFRNQYRQTGRCDSLAILAEVARLAYQRQLVSPKQAEILLEELETIQLQLLPLFNDLRDWLDGKQKGDHSSMTLSKSGFGLLECLTAIAELVDRLTAIARNHPDAPEPGVEEGIASCYFNTVKQVNDLRHSLAYLNQALRPERLKPTLSLQPDLTLRTLEDTVDELQYIALTLIPRLRENIMRKVPQLLGSVVQNSTPANP
jgi:hypothetical protein